MNNNLGVVGAGRMTPDMSVLREKTYSDLWNVIGLHNPTGQNNCFLNSAIQVLWHIDVFRRRFRQVDRHTCTSIGNDGRQCILCALQTIFAQFQYGGLESVSPDVIRNALAATFANEERFQVGLMEDATECFERILSRIHYHLNPDVPEENCASESCIPHHEFAMRIDERVVCSKCAAATKPVDSVQMVCYVSASALADGFEKGYHRRIRGVPSESFGLLLKRAMDLTPRSCPRGRPECLDSPARMHRTLTSSPKVVTVGLIWDSERPGAEQIIEVMQTIDCSLSLDDMFDKVPKEVERRPPLNLVAIISYYGKHYTAFLFHAKKNSWVCVDDSYITEVGSDWRAVVEKCCSGHWQPLLLVYTECVTNISSRVNSEKIPVDLSDQNPPGHGDRRPKSTTKGTTGTCDMGRSSTQTSRNPKPKADSKSADGNCCRQPSYLAAVGCGDLLSRGTHQPSTGLDTWTLERKKKVVQTEAERMCDQYGIHTDTLRSRTALQEKSVPLSRHHSGQFCGSKIHQEKETGMQCGSSFKPRTNSNNPNDLLQWIQNAEDDEGTYIDRRVVENVLRCRQLKRGSANMKLVKHPNRSEQINTLAPDLGVNSDCGSQQSLDHPTCRLSNFSDSSADISAKLDTETETDRDSGISGDRNSASSTSSGLSVESSLTSLGSITDLVSGLHPGDRSSSGSATSILSVEYLGTGIPRMMQPSSTPTVGLVAKMPSPSIETRGRVGSSETLVESGRMSADLYGSLTRRKLTKSPSDALQKAGPVALDPDERCKLLLLEAENFSDKSGSVEKLGDVAQALNICQRAVDLLHTVETVTGVSRDMLVHIRMKRNALVLNVRRLQRLMSSRTDAAPCMKPDVSKPVSNQQLSKEEVGEILVQEIEGRLRRPDGHCLRRPDADVQLPTTAVHRHMKYEEMIKQQLKTFSAKELEKRMSGSGTQANPVVGNCSLNSALFVTGRQSQHHAQHITVADPETTKNRRSQEASIFQQRRSLTPCPNKAEFYARSTGRTTPQLPGSDQSVGVNFCSTTGNINFRPSSESSGIGKSQMGPKIDGNVTTAAGGMTALGGRPPLTERRRSVPSHLPSTASSAKPECIGKKKKSVTFSDNVELLACTSDIDEPVDYVAYAANMLQHGTQSVPTIKSALRVSPAAATCRASDSELSVAGARDSDCSLDDSDGDLDETTANGRVRCSLCRRRWVEPSDTYCLDCSAYMSKLQVSG